MADRHNEDTPLKSEAAIQSGFRPKRLQYALKFIGAALSSTHIVVIAFRASSADKDERHDRIVYQ